MTISSFPTYLRQSGAKNGAMAFSTTTFDIMALSINGSYVTLSLTVLCHFAECSFFVIMLNVIIPSDVMVRVVAPSKIAANFSFLIFPRKFSTFFENLICQKS
jgi:hypothetical protein